MNNTLGSFLKKLRQEQHFTQAYIARYLKISRQAYAYYENSASVPDLDILFSLSMLYHIPLQTFFKYCPSTYSDKIAESVSYSCNSYEREIYPEFLSFFSKQENMKKYHYLNRAEKLMVYLLQKLSDANRDELIQLAYFKSCILPQKPLPDNIYDKDL